MPTASPQVLVVEDDPSVRGLLDTLLSSEGYRVVTASDGIGGLHRGRRQPPGRDPARPGDARPRWPAGAAGDCSSNPALADVPVLVLTGRLEAIPALEDQLGRDRVFSKPFGVADLLSRIAELTGKAPTA